jgi:hypothetical protein
LTRRQIIAASSVGTAIFAAKPRAYAEPKTGNAGLPAIGLSRARFIVALNAEGIHVSGESSASR